MMSHDTRYHCTMLRHDCQTHLLVIFVCGRRIALQCVYVLYCFTLRPFALLCFAFCFGVICFALICNVLLFYPGYGFCVAESLVDLSFVPDTVLEKTSNRSLGSCKFQPFELLFAVL